MISILSIIDRVLRFILLIFPIFVLIACKAKDDKGGAEHVFFLNSATDIYRYDLSKMSVKKIYKGNLGMSSAFIGNIDNINVLVTNYDGLYAKGNGAIFKVNFLTGQDNYVAPGRFLSYFDDEKKIFYTLPNSGGLSIYEAIYKNGKIYSAKKIVKTFMDQAIVLVNADNFAFDDVYHPGKVYLFNDINNKLSYLPIQYCNVLFYRKESKELICNQNNKAIFATSIDGKYSRPISTLNRYVDMDYIAYFPNDDQMIFSVLGAGIFGGEKYYFYSYGFKNNLIKRLDFYEVK